MLWYGIYFAFASVVAIAIFLAGNWFRLVHIAAPDHPGAMSAVAGLFWPVLLVGIAELVVLISVAHAWKSMEQQLFLSVAPIA